MDPKLLALCFRCPLRANAPCAGECPCPVDGRDITDHATTGDCPKNFYPSLGLGDTVEKVLEATGVGPVAKAVIQATTGKPCNCEGRKKLLNRLFPYQ